MPRQKPGRSRQCYVTPREFIKAVNYRFGPLDFDLAATPKNAQADRFYTRRQNSLKRPWEPLDLTFWLNPPFGHLNPWALKCAETAPQLERSGSVLLLVPASVCSNWFRDHVWGKAFVNLLSPRLCFIRDEPYPKDLMLCVFKRKKPRPDQMFVFWDWQSKTLTSQKGQINGYREYKRAA
jgi:phage N-6-adenine-methyltransferase